MSTQDTAKKIVDYIGGPENVSSYTHCATRLRFAIKDEAKIDQESLKSMKEILGVVNSGGQFQLVIGPAVEQVYNQVVPLMKDVTASAVVQDQEAAAQDSKHNKKSVLDSVLGYISNAISPTLPILMGAGMINAVLAIASLLGLDPAGGTYKAWSAVASTAYSYLPVFIAFAGARRLRTNEFLAAAISLTMIICFNQQEGMSMFGLAIPNVKFINCIVPVLLMVPCLCLLDKLIDKILPAVTHFTVKPLIVYGIATPVMLFVFGPFGALVGSALANGCIWLMDTIGSFAMAVLSALHPITVMFGMHYLFAPIMANDLAEMGFTYLQTRALAANFAVAGAAMAVGLKAKKAENKNVGVASSVTALLGVTEPALYGCLIRLRRPLFSACAGAAISGLFLGVFKVHAYAIGAPCLLQLPIFLGSDGMPHFLLACAGAAIGFACGFVITWLVGFDEEK